MFRQWEKKATTFIKDNELLYRRNRKKDEMMKEQVLNVSQTAML